MHTQTQQLGDLDNEMVLHLARKRSRAVVESGRKMKRSRACNEISPFHEPKQAGVGKLINICRLKFCFSPIGKDGKFACPSLPALDLNSPIEQTTGGFSTPRNLLNLLTSACGPPKTSDKAMSRYVHSESGSPVAFAQPSLENLKHEMEDILERMVGMVQFAHASGIDDIAQQYCKVEFHKKHSQHRQQ